MKLGICTLTLYKIREGIEMISETKFEMQYEKVVRRLSDDEGVSFCSALETLYEEFKGLQGNADDFNKLLIDWELKKA